MTPTQRAAMEQALEALELHAKQYPHMQKGYTVDAMTALRAALAETAEPFGHVTVRRLSQRFENHVDQYQFYPAGERPYLDNVDECHAVYTTPQPPAPAVGDGDLAIAYMAGYHAAKKAPAVETPLAQFVNSDRTTLGEQAAQQAVQIQQAAVELTDGELLEALMQAVPQPSLYPHLKGEAVVGDIQRAIISICRAAIAAHEAKKGQP